jgi:hypothetical protein
MLHTGKREEQEVVFISILPETWVKIKRRMIQTC